MSSMRTWRQSGLLVVPLVLATMLLFATSASADSLVISTTAVPNGQVGGAYSETLTATGGTAPYLWSVESGSLPAGLTLSSVTGTISGTPTATGTSTFNVRAVDSVGNATDRSFTLVIDAAGTVTVTTTTLPGGQVGTAYSQPLAASGGTAPYTWAVTTGTLPAGLTLDTSTGAITGTPTTVQTANFTVQATDAASHTDTQDLSIAVTATAVPTVTNASLATGQVGSAYNQTLTATGGTAPYTWAVTAGTLPAGLSLNTATGVISGTPTTAQTADITVQVTDSASQTATKALSIVVASDAALTISTSSLPDAQVGTAYSQTLAATGGAAPYTWLVSSGSLPSGVTLNTATGVISGTPTTAQTADITVQVTDGASQTDTQTLSLQVTASGTGSLAVGTTTLANGQVGTAYNQTLTATGGTGTYTWLVTSGSLPAGLTLNTTTGVISGTPTMAQTANFVVQVTDGAAQTATGTLSIVISEEHMQGGGNSGEHGRCNAINRGSETGRANKAKAPAFANLDCSEQ